MDTTRATLQRLTKHDDAVRASLTPVFASLRSYIVNLYGDDSNEAREFGIEPRKAQKRMLASKVEAVAKERATKAAHHAHPAIVSGVNGASNGASHA